MPSNPGCTVCGANFILKDGLCAACWVSKTYYDDELEGYLRKIAPRPATLTPARICPS